jgi:hypothetical protein
MASKLITTLRVGINPRRINMRKPFVFVFSVIFSLTAAIPSLAAGQGKGREKPQNGKTTVTVIFGGEERRIINEYYRGTSNLPPGLAKRNGNLPPGLQKQLRRNGHLPPGLDKRIEPFPSDLERRLPGLPPIYRRGTIGDRAVIYDSKTNAIMDVIQIVAGAIHR